MGQQAFIQNKLDAAYLESLPVGARAKLVATEVSTSASAQVIPLIAIPMCLVPALLLPEMDLLLCHASAHFSQRPKSTASAKARYGVSRADICCSCDENDQMGI